MNVNTPLIFKNITLKNRLVMPPMASAKCDANGKVSKELLDYYSRKTQGGYIALVIAEHAYVDISGKASLNQMSIASDEDIEGLAKLSACVHKNDSKIFAQINHAGSAAIAENIYAPSAVVHPKFAQANKKLPKAFSAMQIEDLKNAFLNASIRAAKAGFDGVQLHSAHGYLLNQFYSPLSNKRNDEYGSSLANRLKVHIDIIKLIRLHLGNFPISLRLGACDYIDGGNTLDDAILAAKMLEDAGLDLLDISGGILGSGVHNQNKYSYYDDVAKALRENISIPIITTGGISTRNEVDNILKENIADMVGVGRAILADDDCAKNIINSIN